MASSTPGESAKDGASSWRGGYVTLPSIFIPTMSLPDFFTWRAAHLLCGRLRRLRPFAGILSRRSLTEVLLDIRNDLIPVEAAVFYE
ncbi:MAG TPA: hypothetical protein VJW77_10240, partial [Terriglobia bacterium]|nr:hypothetical protein [Terriglobia bacterium]